MSGACEAGWLQDAGWVSPAGSFLPLAGGTMSGDIDGGGNNLTNWANYSGNVNAVTIDAAGAVGESLRRDGTYQPVSVFGSEYQFAANQTPVGTVSGTPQSYLLLTTTTLVGGTYMFSAFVQIGGTAASTGLEVFILIDGAPRGGPLLQTGLAGGRFVFGGSAPEIFAPGVHTLDVQFSHPSGSGTTTMDFANLQLFRVA